MNIPLSLSKKYILLKYVNISLKLDILPTEICQYIIIILSNVLSPMVDRVLKSVNKGKNILLHGPGGTGKSFVMREISKFLNATHKNVFVTASTGIAALNLSTGFDENTNFEEDYGGSYVNDNSSNISISTLHSFAGIRTGTYLEENLLKNIRRSVTAKENWKKCDVLLIDEISMVGGNLFKKLDFIAKNIKKNTLPFGGIQLILSGDFLQLPPVKDSWIFLSEEWMNLKLKSFIFDIPYRYTDLKFYLLLQRVRHGNITGLDRQILLARIAANNKLLSYLKQNETKNMIKPTMFYSTRKDVENYNRIELEKLPSRPVVFNAKDEFIWRQTEEKDNINKEEKIKDYKNLLESNFPSTLVLKIGAQVMLKYNISVNDGLVNGSRGVITMINADTITVKFLNGMEHDIEPTKKFIFDKYVTAYRTQIPLILAYAQTIHKCQGCTLDFASIDIGSSIFENGQAYVALSRCSSIRGTFITNFDMKSIKTSKVALEYVKKLEDI